MLECAATQAESHVALVSREPFVEQASHRQSQSGQQVGSRPVKGFSHRISVGSFRLDANHAKAPFGQMKRSCHPSQTTAHDRHINLREVIRHQKDVRAAPLYSGYSWIRRSPRKMQWEGIYLHRSMEARPLERR